MLSYSDAPVKCYEVYEVYDMIFLEVYSLFILFFFCSGTVCSAVDCIALSHFPLQQVCRIE